MTTPRHADPGNKTQDTRQHHNSRKHLLLTFHNGQSPGLLKTNQRNSTTQKNALCWKVLLLSSRDVVSLVRFFFSYHLKGVRAAWRPAPDHPDHPDHLVMHLFMPSHYFFDSCREVPSLRAKKKSTTKKSPKSNKFCSHCFSPFSVSRLSCF